MKKKIFIKDLVEKKRFYTFAPRFAGRESNVSVPGEERRDVDDEERQRLRVRNKEEMNG
ncbi:hypothetical protein [Taibaiella helva]|uniref:hypothetical protein n=1 Tax=Taibaiella helva TaxID=2301235 RepID=UPI00130050AA|nr:hypothetical protein [Taibaiella helva]